MVRKAASKQLPADPRAKKSPESKARAPPLHSHTLTECLGHHPPNHSGGGVGRKRRGEGSCRWDHGIHPGRQPAFPFLLVGLGFPGGCRGQAAAASPPRPRSGPPACTCRARRQLQLDSSYVPPGAQRAAGATCRAKLQGTCSSGGFAKLRFKAASFFFGVANPDLLQEHNI